MLKNKKIYLIFTIITLILTVSLLTLNNITTATPATGQFITINPNSDSMSDPTLNFKQENTLYCAELGANFNTTTTFEVTKKLENITDQQLAYVCYIAGQGDSSSWRSSSYNPQIGIGRGAAQNLVWYYLHNFIGTGTSLDGLGISSGTATGWDTYTVPTELALYQNTGISWMLGYSNTADGTNPTWDSTEIAKFDNYVNKLTSLSGEYIDYSGISVSIGLSADGSNIEGTVSGLNGLAYDIYVNETYKTSTTSSSFSIPTSGITADKAKVKIVYNIPTQYTGEISLLEAAGTQKLMYFYGEEKTGGNKDTYSNEIELSKDVSMQKYISAVNGVAVSDRSGMKSAATFDGNVGYNIKPSESISVIGSYKEENAVEIEYGDTVTYRIHVYNNSGSEAQNISIVDYLPSYKDSYGNVHSLVDLTNISIIDKYNNDDRLNWTLSTDAATGINYIYKTINVSGDTEDNSSSTYFDITLNFNQKQIKTGNKFNNLALIQGNIKSTPCCRTSDADFIQMKTYDVGLEKYVSKVTDAAGNEQTPLSKDLEPGDLVTYTIKVKNNGSTQVAISEIDETPDSNLSYKSISTGTYDSTNSKITFSTPVSLAAGGSTEVQITYEVTADAGTNNIENKAEVTGLVNRNDYIVTDSDTSDNIDTCGVNTKTYEVKLEKTVTGVKDKAGNAQTFTAGNVYLEPGDLVTYTIKVTNNGSTQVAVSEIDETPHAKLTYNSISAGSSYDETDSKITLSSPVLLDAGKSTEVQITYEVTADAGTNNIENKAEVSKLVNRNDYTVKDSNTTDNVGTCSVNTKIYKVSLEKFVSKVTDDADGNVENYTRQGYARQESWKKVNNKIYLEPGDKVTYTIRVKNTANTTDINQGTSVAIKDITEIPDATKGYLTNGTFVSASYNGATVTGSYDTTNKVIKLNQTLLAPGEYIDVQICYTVDTNDTLNDTKTTKTIENKAEVKELENRNSYKVADATEATDKDNYDSDWVNTKIYIVSLEKFVSKVTDNAGGNVEDYTRQGHAKETQWKKVDNKIYLEPGDLVTYTIRVKNEAKIDATKPEEGTKVAIREIKEMPNEFYLTYNNSVSIANKTGNGKDVSANISYNEDPTSGKIISIDKLLLEPQDYVDIQICYKVDLEKDETNISRQIENKAEVKKLENRNKDYEVKDSEGESNNYDTDWVKTKIYKVSLEKFVSQVTDKFDGNIENYTREGHAREEDWKKAVNNPYKDNKVYVEEADKVIYTIRVKNKAAETDTENTKVAIMKIKEAPASSWEFDGELNFDSIKIAEKTANGISVPNNMVVNYDKNNNMIELDKLLLEPGDSIDLYISYNIKYGANTWYASKPIKNAAEIERIENRNTDYEVDDSSEILDKDNSDYDWIHTKRYDVSLEKYVSKVENVSEGYEKTYNREGKYQYLIGALSQKYQDVVNVKNGDIVTYTIKLKNEGSTTEKETNTKVRFTNIIDILPEGLRYLEIKPLDGEPEKYIEKNKSLDSSNNTVIQIQEANIPNNLLVEPGDIVGFKITAEVLEPNISLRILKNEAKIDKIQNRNQVEVTDLGYIYKPTGKVYLSDLTYNDKIDSDFVQLTHGGRDNNDKSDDVVISGTIWNDRALEKTGDNYNGIFDIGDEDVISENVKVYLFRTNFIGYNQAGIVAWKNVNLDGTYSFSDADLGEYRYENKLNDTELLEANKKPLSEKERYIKARKHKNYPNRWDEAHGYYSYIVIFEYDGVKYTSTPNGYQHKGVFVDSEYQIDSNAKESHNRTNTRKEFNKKFTYIRDGKAYNSDNTETGDISYNTINERDKIPQSEHKYNYDIMKMNSITDTIKFDEVKNILNSNMSFDEKKKKIDVIEDKLRYVGLGLRGRDIFDLEITSDVSQVEVKVNDVVGVYKYQNKVQVRAEDDEEEDKNKNTKPDIIQDMAYKYTEQQALYVEERGGPAGTKTEGVVIRDTDFTGADSKNLAQTNVQEYEESLQSIHVTYKITVKNTSKTFGTATKLINYYDNRYKRNSDLGKVAYYIDNAGNKQWLTVEDAPTEANGPNHKAIIITTQGKTLASGSSPMDVYVRLELRNAKDTLKHLVNTDKSMPTYNMSEIYEYTTSCGTKQTEYTRGLLDKDSAPGSAYKEQVRTTENEGLNTPTVGGSKTTVDYYFDKKDNESDTNYLKKLKYEDDTYATPTLYFSTDSSIRKLRGTVFEDYTEVNNDNVRTGNGKQDDIEPGIYKAKVELLEYIDSSDPNELNYYNSLTQNTVEIGTDKYVIRYHTETNISGEYKFENYLPGKYIVRFYYGDNSNTFYIKYDTWRNGKSYNGQDFQATNNKHDVIVNGVQFVNKLDTTAGDYWYVDNYTKEISTATDDKKRRDDVSSVIESFTKDELQVLNNVRDGKKESEAILGTSVTDIKADIIDETYMYANTPNMLFTLEQVWNFNTVPLNNRNFNDNYNIYAINFGIAEVPVAIIDLEKHVNSFEIKDSAGTNTLAGAKINYNAIDVIVDQSGITDSIVKSRVNKALKAINNIDDNLSGKTTKFTIKATDRDQIRELKRRMARYTITSDIIQIKYNWDITAGSVVRGDKPTGTILDVSIEDERLQGARLEVTYDITVNMFTEKNFDGKTNADPQIASVIDLIDNDLSFISNDSNKGWKIINADRINYGDSGASNSMGMESKTEHTSIVSNLKDDLSINSDNLLSGLRGNTANWSATQSITLERVLSSTDITVDDIITSSIDAFEYENEVRINQLKYNGSTNKFKDRVRTLDRHILVPGVSYDGAKAEIITIHPPTGETAPRMNYYIITAIALAILAIGTIGIKKFVVKK